MAAVLAGLYAGRVSWIRSATGVLVAVLLGMQVVGSFSIIGTVFDEEADTPRTYLSTEGLYEVAPGKNTVVFVLDRFDYAYYRAVLAQDPDLLQPLTGFTVFEDNISLYSRTYPAIGSMITGLAQENADGTPFAEDADTYFTRAYSTSPFLRDLKANDWSVRLYTGPYYGYRDAEPLQGIADNVDVAVGHRISNMYDLLDDMIKLTLYRLFPQVLKESIKVTTAMFNSLVQYEGEDPAYTMDDAALFQTLRQEGLTVSQENNMQAFLVQSSGLRTQDRYGVSYLDVPEGQNVTRHHRFTISKQGSYAVLYYTINGNGHDFANWEMTDSIPIGYLYR